MNRLLSAAALIAACGCITAVGCSSESGDSLRADLDAGVDGPGDDGGQTDGGTGEGGDGKDDAFGDASTGDASTGDAAAEAGKVVCPAFVRLVYACTDYPIQYDEVVTSFSGTVVALGAGASACVGPDKQELGTKHANAPTTSLSLSDGTSTVVVVFAVPGLDSIDFQMGAQLTLTRNFVYGSLTDESWVGLMLSDASGPLVAVMDSNGVGEFNVRRGEMQCSVDCMWRAEALVSCGQRPAVSIGSGERQRVGGFDVTNEVYGGETESEDCGGYSEYGIEPYVVGAVRLGAD